MSYEINTLFEHRFWLQVLGDHARFIYNALSPSETEKIRSAKYFIKGFDQLLQEARQNISGPRLNVLNQQAKQMAEEIRLFKLELIRQHLVGDIKISLPPTFINHMVNEVEKYLRILACLLEGSVIPAVHPLEEHILWLPDAAGHASAIVGSLDAVEKELIMDGECYQKRFEQLFIKAFEMKGYLRTNLCTFPALTRFNNQVEEKILDFKKFLRCLEDMTEREKVLSTLYPLLLDHMAREECYYLTKLSRVAEGVIAPPCNPTKPRT